MGGGGGEGAGKLLSRVERVTVACSNFVRDRICF